MSYMRGKHYVWVGSDGVHINSVVMPGKKFDELVAMRWAELNDKQRKAAARRGVKNWSGNVGCIVLCEAFKKKGKWQKLMDSLAAQGRWKWVERKTPQKDSP